MNKVTLSDIEKEIADVGYSVMGMTTICHITLKSGWSSTGIASCASPDWFSEEIGKEVAYNDALDPLFSQFTFARFHNLK